MLVTGAAGFIGSNLCLMLQAQEIEVLAVDDLSAGVRLIPDEVEFRRLNCGQLADNPTLLRRADAIVHLAAKPSVEFANKNPLEALDNNVKQTLQLLLAANGAGVKRFIFASSNAAVGSAAGPIYEELTPKPGSFYGASKLAGEAYCLAAAKSLGIHAVTLRFANVYGPLSDHKESAINKFVRLALANRPITINGDGRQTRDFIFVEDICRAILRSLSVPYESSVFQIGAGVETSILEVVEILGEILGQSIQTQSGENVPGDIRTNYSDIRRAVQLRGGS